VEIGVLLSILAAAAFVRFVRLDAVPPGMTHDEAAFGAEAELILAGERPLYFALGYGHEPLYAYLVAGVFMVLGRTLFALRVTSALCGLLVVLMTYLLARRMFGLRVAWITAAWMAVAFWPLSLSRQALRAITLPMLWLPAAWLFWEGLRASSASPPPDDAGYRSQAEDESGDLESATWNVSRVPRVPQVGHVGHTGRMGRLQPVLFSLSGLFLGASFYTYMASRIAWLVFPLFGLYLLLQGETRRLLRRAWPGFALTLLVAGLVALPLMLYLRVHPAAEVRVEVMMGPIRDLLAGRPARVLDHIWDALRVFSFVGDRFWAYNIPGRPVFNWVGSVVFYLGLAVAVWRWRDPRYAYLVLCLLVGLAPAMVTTNEGIFLRAIVAQPATYVLVALGACAVGLGARGLMRRWAPKEWRHRMSRVGSLAFVGLAVVLVAMEGARTVQAYFYEWPSQPETRNIYNHNLVASARTVGDAPSDVPAVGVSALYPLYYHDPWIWRYVAVRDDLAMRWFDGRGGIVYPAQGEARYVISALTQLHPALRADFEAQATRIVRQDLAARDQNPYFEVWRWNGQKRLAADLDALQARSPMWISPEVQFTQPELRQRLGGPAQFGDVMALVGYRLSGHGSESGQDSESSPGSESGQGSGQTVGRGESVELVTYWRALRTVQAQDDWDTFVHLLDRDSKVIGAVDVLHSPPTGWQPGDVVVQVHVFDVAADAPQGPAYLEIGVYRHQTGRQPVVVDGQVVGDRVLLDPVRVE
jgi:4-amino-4-deoxy-L-arabinose transferase-like glycosyltransferase